jgi:hypothetical protein
MSQDMATSERLTRRLVRGALRALERALTAEVTATAAVAEATRGLAAATARLGDALTALEIAAEASRPFTADTTVHRAWARHPGVKAIFTRYHLPACDACAVGADETLGEAALGYQIPLNDLLDQLNTLRR